ncbi:MAG: hypothetical protein CMF31_06450 [Kordiimonas sp.]|nr:hypothetical protein [Kordiimonas sp.]
MVIEVAAFFQTSGHPSPSGVPAFSKITILPRWLFFDHLGNIYALNAYFLNSRTARLFGGLFFGQQACFGARYRLGW